MPGGSGVVAVRLKPEGMNCDPKIAPTSGRETPIVATPTKIGAPATGIAQTWTASMPVPLDANWSSVQPAMANGTVSVAPRVGESVVSRSGPLTVPEDADGPDAGDGCCALAGPHELAATITMTKTAVITRVI